MRRIAALLALLLTATAARAGIRVNGRELSRQEEIGLYCSVCMAVVFVPLLIVVSIQVVREWRAARRQRNVKRGPPDFR